MGIAHFRGKVLPVAANFTLKNALSFDWIWDERNMTISFKVSIAASDIHVECAVPNYRDADIVELHRRAYDLCRANVSMNAFRQGVGLFVVLDRFTSPTGRQVNIMGHDGRLPPLCTAIHDDNDFNTVFLSVLKEPILIRHLSDLIISISTPHEAIINCSRVIEGIKHLVAPNEDDDSKAWQQMRSALNVDKAYLTLITESSTNARHGRAERRGGLLVNEIVLRSWTVMNRFMEYRKRGNVPLESKDFCQLNG